MTKSQLLDNLASVERRASVSKLRRMLHHPARYLTAILHRQLFYRWTKSDIQVKSSTFFGEQMHLRLPSSTDIYLTGGKPHDSEIRLAAYLIHQLDLGDTFVDVGAHYGYFTLLASSLVGKGGTVISYEPSPNTYSILHQNVKDIAHIKSYNSAVSDSDHSLTFYEFPNYYSEYNTFDVTQFVDKDWYQIYPPEQIKVNCVQLQSEIESLHIDPKIIKIDVEGAEYQVIKGMQDYLSAHSTTLVMEYLNTHRGNSGHQQAEHLLKTLGYSASIINRDGSLQRIGSASAYLDANAIESENIVFAKRL